jgi:hypothetical protein
MSWLGYVVLGIFALTIGVVILRVWLRRLHDAAIRDADEALAAEAQILREPAANLFGVRSGGMGQVRGNGVLTLTNRRLHFMMWLPRREVSIDLLNITGIETPKSFLGKSKLRPLLQVNFTDERGDEDAAAWLVADLEEWTETLDSRTRR